LPIARVDFKAAEQRAAPYLAINPKARVPALVTDRGVLTETPAILAFIAQGFPQAKLAPLDDPFAFAELQAFNAYLCSTVHIVHAHRMRGARWADEQSSYEDMRRRIPGNMAACFELVETTMFKGPWVMGKSYTVADPYLFTMSSWLGGDGVDIAKFPRVADHSRRMAERETVKRAYAMERAA
jgi:glutathione S-transferase